MTTPLPLIDSKGRPVPLEAPLAEGGEGAVFSLRDDAMRLAKVYHRPRTARDVEKLTAMVGLANGELSKVAAWPDGLLRDSRSKRVVGFTMTRLVDYQPIQHLYNPVQRLKFFSRAGWAFQVRAAQNLAAAFEEVHRAGCLVGDVNQSNELVSPDALVRLIDCDSFQVRAHGEAYSCDVGTPLYTPPELQGRAFRGLVRSENHDRFGLAVLVYQLLFVGRHPYSGIYRGADDPPFDRLIAEFRFAQGPMAHTWMMEPPPHTPTFADVPPQIGALFRRAFERGSEGGTRPEPAEWLVALKGLEEATAECASDAGHRYWKGAGRCTWCRLAERGGPEYYYGVGGTSGGFSVDGAKLREVLARLTASKPVDFPYDRHTHVRGGRIQGRPIPPAIAGVLEETDADPPLEAKPSDEGRQSYLLNARALLVATLGGCALMPLGCIRAPLFFIGLLIAVGFGVWLAMYCTKSPYARATRAWAALRRRKRWERQRAETEYHTRLADEARARHRAFRNAETALIALEAKWAKRVEEYRAEHRALAATVAALLSECRNLEPAAHAEVQLLKARAEAAAQIRHLRLHLIADADIPSVGAQRKRALASHNVFTAADVDGDVILKIKGFGRGLTDNVLAWKNEVLRRFQFDPNSAVSPGERQQITARYRNRQRAIFAEADRRLSEMSSLAPACKGALESILPEIEAAISAWKQIDADYRLIGTAAGLHA